MTTERLKVENLFCYDDGTVVLSPQIKVDSISVTLDTTIDHDETTRLDDFDAAEAVSEFFNDGSARDEASYTASITWNRADRVLELNEHSIPELIRYIVSSGDFPREYKSTEGYTRGHLSGWHPGDAEHEFISAANAFKQACINFILPKDQRRVNNAG